MYGKRNTEFVSKCYEAVSVIRF